MSLLEEQKVKEYLEKEYAYVFDRHRPEPEPVKGDFRIWFSWFQGWDAMPRLVRRCWENLNRRAGRGKVCFIDRTNFRRYVSLPSRVLNLFENGSLTVQSFSDILRFALLNEYGGLWVDATVFVTDDLENHPEIFRSPFFSIGFEQPSSEFIANNRWTGYFQGTGFLHYPLYGIGCDIFYEYLRTHERFEVYLFVDVVMALIYEKSSTVRDAVDQLPKMDANQYDLFFFQRHFNEKGDRSIVKEQMSRGLIQKLNWRRGIDENVPDSYINILLGIGNHSIDEQQDGAATVTVVIPVYNSEKYLRECLDSVLHQTMKEIEVICIDDGSVDRSVSILEEYAARDPRIHVLQQEHRGAGVARNTGIVLAKGKYLYFLDSDDWIAPDMLEKMYAEAEKLGADVVVCHADRFLDGSNERHSFHNYVENMLPSRKPFVAQDVPYNLFGTFIWWVSDRFYLRSFVEKIGIMFQELPSMEDLLFSVATMLKARRISYIPDILSHQRARKDSLTATQYKTWDTYYRAFITIKDFMKNEGIYEFWKQDFINHCVRFSLWQLQILPETVSKKLAALLREKGCHELGLLGLSSYYFYEPKQYFDFLKALGSIEMDALIYREAGYNFLYPCYRLLVECEPQSILEFHLGRVTKLVAGYAAKAGAGHLVLENRPKEQVERMIAQWDMPFRSTEFRGGVLLQARRPGEIGVAYQHFEELAGNRQYDLILLTCPPGGDTLPHMDLLPLLPGILLKDFAILMDHAESRYGKRVLQDMEGILAHHHILFEREDFTDDNGTVASIVSKGWEYAMGGVRR